MSKNEKLLKSFTSYCYKHKEERFWQALRNWAKFNFLMAYWTTKEGIDEEGDTFYFTEKNK